MDTPPRDIHVRFMPFDLLIEQSHQTRDVMAREAPEYFLNYDQRARVRAHGCPPEEPRRGGYHETPSTTASRAISNRGDNYLILGSQAECRATMATSFKLDVAS